MIELFHRNFDTETEPVPGPGSAGSPAGSAISEGSVSFLAEEVERMLAEARAEAFETGRIHGKTEAAEDREHVLAQSVRSISESLETLSGDAARIRQEVEADIADFIVSVAERLVPGVVEGLSTEIVAERIRTGLRSASGNDAIRVLVPPPLLEAVAEKLPAFERLNDRGLELKLGADDGLSGCAVRVEWESGRMEYDLDRTCDEVIAIMKTALCQLNRSATGKD